MAPVASKFDTLPFNCYELGHTWSPHCSQAAGSLGVNVFSESLKIYTSCYVLSLIATRRFPKTQNDFLKIVKDILRSSAFLTMNGFGFVTVFCALRKILGRFNFFSVAYLPAAIACYVSILIEKPSRRPLLALYVTNVASETIFRMLRARGYVQNIKNFDMFLFVLSCTTLLYQMKKGNRRNDIIDTIFTKILGREEFLSKDRPGEVIQEEEVELNEEPNSRPIAVNAGGLVIGEEEQNAAEIQRRRLKDQSYRARFIRFVLWMHKCVEDIACQLERMVTDVYEGQIHERCPHKDSCLDYWLKGFSTRFASGFGIQAAIQSAFILRRFLIRPGKKEFSGVTEILKQALIKCIKSGAGLSAMCLAFRLLNCSFRWLSGSDDARGCIASAIMSSALGFILLRPPSTLGLYLFFKAAETVISQSHKENNWKIIRWIDSVFGGGWCLLYALSTAVLFHTGMMEPQNLKPSYYVFLSKVTGRKLQDINRHLLTVYGTNSNLLMKDFWPDLDTRFISDDMKKLIKMREASGQGNRFIQEIARTFMPGFSAV